MEYLHGIFVPPFSNALFLVFLILFLGFAIGRIQIKGVSLGAAGVFLVALVFGHFSFGPETLLQKIGLVNIDVAKYSSSMNLVQNLGLLCFVTSVGFIAGPKFFYNLKVNAKSYALIGVVIIGSASLTTAAIIKYASVNSAMAVGVLSGALTTTPGFAAAQDVIKGDLEVAVKDNENAQAQFATAWQELLPVVPEGADLQHVTSLVEGLTGAMANLQRQQTLEASDNAVKAAQELATALGELQNDGNADDYATALNAMVEAQTKVATTISGVQTQLDLLNEVTVGHAVGYPFGVVGVVLFVQLVPLILRVNMEDERRKLSASSDAKERALPDKLINIDPLGLAPFSLAIILGILLGRVSIPLPGGATFALGNTGGALIVGLILGHFGHIGPLNMRLDNKFLASFREFGLVLFLIGAGVPGGGGFVEKINEYGFMLFVYGAIMELVPLFLGFLVARYLVKLCLLNNLGSITGGMTSTPALGALIGVAKTDDVAAAYAATYPVALVFVVLASQFLVALM
ncbi:MAG: hypothetical protein Q4G03_00515 [Planctomycetia bacterium]|nr:hypothetical protein [Planctomycetia bacterium]